jgi:geranylgeranyl diphosphate synthase type II
MNPSQTNFLKTFELHLNHALHKLEPSLLKSAMNYALLAGGKRFRPLLVHACASETAKLEDVCVLAGALEMVHTYSLVHDDLPALDNDDLRRGQPTVHKQYDEALAILAGDGLLNLAYESILESHLTWRLQRDALAKLAFHSGSRGMIYGQLLDMYPDSNELSFETLKKCYMHKTGNLFAAALELGALLNPVHLDGHDLTLLGQKMGVVFQIQDDYLEAISDTKTLGKSNQSDLNNEKTTILNLAPLETIQTMIEREYDALNRAIINLPFNTQNLRELIQQMYVRKR